jgi:hypothetical protein
MKKAKSKQEDPLRLRLGSSGMDAVALQRDEAELPGADKDEYIWGQALAEADETGDLRKLLKLLVSGETIPGWVVEELAQLFANRKLHVPRRSPEHEHVAVAHGIYRASRRRGEAADKRFDRVAEALDLSKKQQTSLRHLINGDSGASVRPRGKAREVSALEQSLRELWLKRYPTA